MLDQSRTPYADAVKAYGDRDLVRLNTPGHQVSSGAHSDLISYFGREILANDVQPFVDGIDYGTYPTPLDESLELAAAAWGARKTWFLTNGASKGNLMACLATRNLGEKIVVQRSVHSSVIDGLGLTGFDAEFVYPSVDKGLGIANGVTPESLGAAIERSGNPVAAYIVTPSYFGAVADVKALADVAHAHNIPLIVDEAWGAHFGFHPEIPVNSIRLGADIVISSTHKLAGSLTQSAMLHLSESRFADTLEPLLDRAFKSLQSTSASALLTASLDIARKEIATRGATSISETLVAMQALRDGFNDAGRFVDIASHLMTYDDVVEIDPLRIALNTLIGGISGHEARSILFNDFGVHCEIATHSTIVLLVGAGVVPDVERIMNAFHQLPRHHDNTGHALELPAAGERVSIVRDAYFAKTEIVDSKAAIGRVSADSVAAYPPGIPNLLPGERITAETVAFLQATIAAPYGHVRGGANPEMTAFRVVAH